MVGLSTKPRVYVVAGSTASGKSSFALREALKNHGTIINADSQQLLEGLPILTACPSVEETLQVPHKLYQHLPYNTPKLCVQTWLNLLCATLENTLAQGRTPWIVGGTGFYLKAFLQGLSPVPSIPPEVYQQARSTWGPFSTLELHGRLMEQDPMLAQRLSPTDRQRIERGLMVYQHTGQPLSTFQSHARQCPSAGYDLKTMLLWPPKDVLQKKMAQRWDAMEKAGVLEEVAAFTQRPHYASSPLIKAIGFQETHQRLQGKMSREEAMTRILQKTSQYAKRQRCWFRHSFVPQEVIS